MNQQILGPSFGMKNISIQFEKYMAAMILLHKDIVAGITVSDKYAPSDTDIQYTFYDVSSI